MVKFTIRRQVEMFSFKYLALPVVSLAYDVLHIISLFFSFWAPHLGGFWCCGGGGAAGGVFH